VILVDANLLIYAHVESFEQHAKARDWLDSHLNGRERVGLPWASILAFVRIVTNPRIFDSPEPVDRAWQQVADWLECPVSWIPLPTQDHAEILRTMLTATGLGGNLVPDAHLAALAVEHGLRLYSSDSDFARFPDLNWENPLN
jgi:hypothetical protein